jgi:hypothetical protein
MKKLLDVAKREPVRVASVALALLLTAISLATGSSIEALMAQLFAVTVLLERTRALVSPLVLQVIDVLDGDDDKAQEGEGV